MKRISAQANPFGNHADEIMSKMASFFSRSAMDHIPEVTVELNSFNVSDGRLTWYGDMTYQKNNQPLTLSIPGEITEDMTFDNFGRRYFNSIVAEYIRQLDLVYHI